MNKCDRSKLIGYAVLLIHVHHLTCIYTICNYSGERFRTACLNLQASGEGRFTDDMPRCENELQAALVTSTVAKATITDVDYREALVRNKIQCSLAQT